MSKESCRGLLCTVEDEPEIVCLKPQASLEWRHQALKGHQVSWVHTHHRSGEKHRPNVLEYMDSTGEQEKEEDVRRPSSALQVLYLSI